MSRRSDLTGQTFGLLTAIADAGGPPKGNARPWRCVCACGRERIASSSELRADRVHSCGCQKAPLRANPKLSWPDDDDLLQADILGDLEAEFGEMSWPVPTGPVWHQTLSSDAELGAFAR